MAVNLYDHQRAGIMAALTHLRGEGRGYYLAHEPGLGKTLSSICIARLLGARKIVVISPKVALYVWSRQQAQWWPEAETHINAVGYRSSKPSFHVVNFDHYRAHEKQLQLALRDADLLIADEAQTLKNPQAKITKAIQRLAPSARHLLLLSGTPAHSPLDWWSQYRLIAPQDPYWSQPYKAYKSQVARLGGPHQNWVVGERPDGVAEAKTHLAPYTHVAVTAELDLPEPVRNVVNFDLSLRELRVYKEMERDLVADLDKDGQATVDLVLTKLLRLAQITGGWVPDDNTQSPVQLGTSKLDSCLELLDQWSAHKVVVAFRFAQEVEQVFQALTPTSRAVRKITGDTPAERRSDIERWFQRTDQPAVLLINERAGGVSLTLTAARALILYSVGPSVITYRQLLGRVHRIGTTHAPQIYSLQANSTLDAVLYQALEEKCDVVALVSRLRQATWKG